jgi:hypothetical protein
MATPLGPRLLGVPGAAIQQCSLKSVVNGMHYYNRSMALMNMLRSTAEHHAAMPLHHDTTESSGSGSDSDAREAGVAMRTAAARGRLQEGVQQYCKTLAASALWLALSAKVMAEDGGLGSQPVSRRLAKSFMQHEMPSEAGMDMASVNGGVLHSQVRVAGSGACRLGTTCCVPVRHTWHHLSLHTQSPPRHCSMLTSLHRLLTRRRRLWRL